MKRSPERRIGLGRWSLGTAVVVVVLFGAFSLVPPTVLEGEWPMRIRPDEVSLYTGLFDRRPRAATAVLVESYHIGASRQQEACLLDQTGPGWKRRWFEAEGYGDSAEVRRSRTTEGGWSVKFEREAPFNTQRRIELIPAGLESMRAKYLEILATELGLLTPEVSFVRVIACGRDLGLYLKEEWVGPEFMEKHGLADAALFEQGFDTERPDHLVPIFEDDMLAAHMVRSSVQQVHNELENGSRDAVSKALDKQAALGWLLLRWLETPGDPFGEEGLFAYRWNTGLIVPIYRRGRVSDRTQVDTTVAINFNLISALLRTPAGRAMFDARREKLIEQRARLKERFAAADAAWLPILAGSTSHTTAQARAAAIADELLIERLDTDPLMALDRPMVSGPGWATLVDAGSPERSLPSSADHGVFPPPSLRLKVLVQHDTVVFPRGKYVIEEDLIIPHGYTVVLEQGARFTIAPGSSVLCQGPLFVRGTARNPVFVRAQQDNAPFGTFAVSCREGDRCEISGLYISGGSGARINGLHHPGMVSIHGASSTTLVSCVVSGSSGEEALDIKGGDVLLKDCVFEDGHAGLVDLDRVTGVVRDCVFKNGRADSSAVGLSVNGSHLLVENCSILGMKDQGSSSGVASQVLMRNNRFEGNRLAIAAKDLSVVYVYGNTFRDNAVVLGAYRKKPIYGGARLVLGTNVYEGNARDRDVDPHSSIVQQDSLNADVLKLFGTR